MPFIRPLITKNTNLVEQIYEFKGVYDNDVIPYIKDINSYIPFNDLYGKNYLYGLVDLDGDIVYPTDIKNNFTFFLNENGKEVRLQNFVADALQDMKEYLGTAAGLGKITKNSVFNNIKVYKANENLTNQIVAKQAAYALLFKQRYTTNNKLNSSIKNVDDFIKNFIFYLSQNNFEDSQITKTSIILSTNFTNFNSGLIFEFAQDDYFDDTNKFDKYLNSPDFACFAESCIRFGFMIDKNVPWRLSANLNSPAMLKYMKKYFINNPKELFAKRYKKVYIEEVQFLKQFFYVSYSSFLNNNKTYEKNIEEMCEYDYINSSFLEREEISIEDFANKYTDDFWIKVYLYFRNLETKTGLTQIQYDNLVREAQSAIKYDNTDNALKFVNSRIDNFKNILYLRSLQPKNSMIQPVLNSAVPKIIF